MTDPLPAGQAEAAAEIRRKSSKIIFFAMVVVSFLCLMFREGYIAPNHHTDKGVAWAFNYFAQHGLVYGRDIAFTYGPLAWLSAPLAVGSNIFWADLLVFGVHVLLVACLWLMARRTGDYLRTAPIFIALLLPRFPDTFIEVEVTLIAMLCFLESVHNKKSLAFIAPAALAALFMYAKLGVGMSLGALYFVYLVFSRVLNRDSLAFLALKVAVPAAFFATIGFFCFRSFDDFTAAVRISASLVNGYSEATVLPCAPEEIWTALLLFAMMLVPVKWIKEAHGRYVAAFWGCLAVAAAFLIFKHSFVRADWHIEYFFVFVPAAAATCCVFVPLRKCGPLLAVLLIVASQGMTARFSSLNPLDTLSRASPESLIERLNPAAVKAKTLVVHRRNLALDTLTEDEVKAIGQSTVDIFPFDAYLIGERKLKWRPNPVVQPYYAYSAAMDARLRDHYAGPNAAEFIVMRFQDVDGRNPFFTAPLTYREILEHYRFVSQTGDRLLLKRDAPAGYKLEFIGSTDAQWFEPITVPPAEGIVVAEIQVKTRVLAGLKKFFYKAPATYIDMMSDAGDMTTFRFTPWVSGSGMFVSPLPYTLNDVRALFDRDHLARGRRFVSFRITYGSSRYYEPGYRINFYELRVPYPAQTQPAEVDRAAFLGGLTQMGVVKFPGEAVGRITPAAVEFGDQKYTLEPRIEVWGWAVDRNNAFAYADMAIEIEGKLYEARRVVRPDIAYDMKNKLLEESGFALSMPVIPLSENSFKIYIRHRDGKSYRVIEGALKI